MQPPLALLRATRTSRTRPPGRRDSRAFADCGCECVRRVRRRELGRLPDDADHSERTAKKRNLRPSGHKISGTCRCPPAIQDTALTSNSSE